MRPDRLSRVLLMVPLLLACVPGAAQDVLRDPTRPYKAPEYVSASPVRFAVHAIVSSDKRRLAIVNGRRVRVGDEIDGAIVRAIHNSEVVLEIDGLEKTLTLHRGGRQR